MSGRSQKDLIVLVADKNMGFAVKGLLARNHSLGIRQLEKDIYEHPQRDPGCLHKGAEFLHPFRLSYAHALLIFDYEGSGSENRPVSELYTELEQSLFHSGWENRAAAIIINPELENWVWSTSPHVAEELGWAERTPSLREWLEIKGYVAGGQVKPERPKEAMEEALREARKRRSSSIYQSLASRVSFRTCTDDAFNRLVKILQNWFGNL